METFETLIDIKGKAVIGNILNPRFVVQDVNWVYKGFQTEYKAEFEKEKDILRALELGGCSHQCRIEAFGYARRGDKQYYCIKMPWYGKNSLDTLLANFLAADLSEDNVVRLIDKMLAPFLELEDMGFRHNDIAPENIFMKENGDFVLIDFGAACRVDDIAKGKIGELEMRGHAEYNAPEKQGRRLLPSSDIYSFGKLLGKVIKRGEDLGVKYSDRLISICVKCREHESGKRYQSFQDVASAFSELREQLNPAQIDAPKTHHPTKNKERNAPPRTKNKLDLRIVAVRIVAVLAIVVSFSFLTMEIYLTFFRTYGESTLEKTTLEKRTVGNDVKLTIYDIMNFKNYKHNGNETID
jgi:serine/threonine protein kinase